MDSKIKVPTSWKELIIDRLRGLGSDIFWSMATLAVAIAVSYISKAFVFCR